MAMYDTIIIGAGMSGLAAGIRLARFGQRVCILERHSAVGGLNSYYRCHGRSFDVGLHALTNYAPEGSRRGPLARVLRQLRISWDELPLAPQIGSAIVFPGVTLWFSNDFELFRSQVQRHFPHEKDNFERLLAALLDYQHFGQQAGRCSARAVVASFIEDPLLVEMLLCPIMFYGGSREEDIDFDLFSILFRSIFLEGLARPAGGVRVLLKALMDKLRQFGGDLRLRSGVGSLAVRNGCVEKVILDDGRELAARNVLSSAGWAETLRLCEDASPVPSQARISFVESISVLDRQPGELGFDRTIVFFNDSEKFHYRRPQQAVDLRSGVVCSPNNFLYPEPLSEGQIRISALANYQRWAELEAEGYRQAKLHWYRRLVESAVRFVPDFRHAVVHTEIFTPLTIRRFTGHDDGAVYGAAEKNFSGATHLRNLFICGNDQGLVGIVGAMTSGISVANKYLLALPEYAS